MPRKALFRFAENFETRTIHLENFETNYIYIGVLLMEITLTSAEPQTSIANNIVVKSLIINSVTNITSKHI